MEPLDELELEVVDPVEPAAVPVELEVAVAVESVMELPDELTVDFPVAFPWQPVTPSTANASMKRFMCALFKVRLSPCAFSKPDKCALMALGGCGAGQHQWHLLA